MGTQGLRDRNTKAVAVGATLLHYLYFNISPEVMVTAFQVLIEALGR